MIHVITFDEQKIHGQAVWMLHSAQPEEDNKNFVKITHCRTNFYAWWYHLLKGVNARGCLSFYDQLEEIWPSKQKINEI